MIDVIKWIATEPYTFNDLYGKSQYTKNQMLSWCPSDTEELFNRNLQDPVTAARIRELGWTDTSITYKFNNHGFRTPDDWHTEGGHEGNMFLGCSVTMGIGLNIEDTWGHKVSTTLGGKFYNLAQAGTGLEAQYRMLKSWAPFLKPKRIFTLGAYEPRREFLSDNGGSFIFSPMSPKIEESELAPFIFSDREARISAIRTMDAMRAVASKIGAELWYPRQEDIYSAHKVPDAGKSARDLIHAGKNWHTQMAKTVKNWIRLE